MVSVRRSETGNLPPRLRPGNSARTVRMNNSSQQFSAVFMRVLNEKSEEFDVRRRVGRRSIGAFYNFAVQIDNDHVGGRHGFIRNAAGLDDKCVAGFCKLPDVAPRQRYESVLDQVEVFLTNDFF